MNLAAPLPLSSAEKKLAPASRTILIGVETFVQGQIGTLKTPAARTSFWNSLCGYSTRNHTASTTGEAATKKPVAAAAKSKTAKAAAKTRSRGAGAA